MASFTCIYLSETGVGETIAERLHTESRVHGVECNLLGADQFSRVSWDTLNVLVVVASSTGDGDPPEKALKFWRWIRSPDRPSSLLQTCHYALLGLGSSDYSSFMQVPRRLDASLKKLGARPFLERTEADDATPDGLESVVEPWIEKLWPALKKQLQLSAGPDLSPAPAPAAPSTSGTHPRLAEIGFDIDVAHVGPLSPSLAEDDALFVEIAACKVLTAPEAQKEVVHLTLKSPHVPLPSYRPGDSIYVRCPNLVHDVDFVLSRLAPHERDVIACRMTDGGKSAEFWPHHVPRVVETFQALSWYVDLAALPSKRLLRALADCCTDTKDAQNLMDLCENSKSGKERYAVLANGCVGLPGLLRQHPSCVPSMRVLLALLPVHKPRSYSVACAAPSSLQTVEIVFSVVRLANGFRGNCTNWLVQMASATSEDLTPLLRQMAHWRRSSSFSVPLVPIRFQPPTSFRFPPAVSTCPIIMVGPGTGVAPFRGFCQLIEQMRTKDDCFPECHLFFGCRDMRQDYLFREEWEMMCERGVLQGLHVAASRQNPTEVVYVQHLMEQQWKLISEALLDRAGYLYVCGDARSMAPDVQKTVEQIFAKAGRSDAAAIVADMKKSHRYLVDVWA